MSSIGLDVGTTGCKATVIRENGEVAAFAYKGYDTEIPQPGYMELNPEIVWRGVQTVLAKVAEVCADEIDAIAVASFGEAFVCLSENGETLSSSILFSDYRGTDEIQDIIEKIDKQSLFELTGMPINSMYTLNKLLWVKKNSTVYDDAKYIMLYGDFISYKLSGKRFIDYSLASRTMMFDYKKKGWARDLMVMFDIDVDKFSEPIECGGVIGALDESVAKKLGLKPSVVMIAGAHDQVCAALGAGVLNHGESVDGIGTSECITVLLSEDFDTSFMLENEYCIEPYVLADSYVTLAFNPAAGAAINWYRSTIEKTRSETAEDIFCEMEKECPNAPTGVIMIPYFLGTGTPYMDSRMSAAFLGLKSSTTRGDLYRACLEGLCLDIKLNVQKLKEMGTQIEKVYCVGGAAKSDLLIQIKADVMGTETLRIKKTESGTVGLAMLCFKALGVFKDFDEATEKLIETEKVFLPDRDKAMTYDALFEQYKRAYRGLKFIYEGKPLV